MDTTPRIIPGAASLGPLRLVEEQLHAHGRRTKPYPIHRTYETLDGSIRLSWSKRHGVHASFKRHDRAPYTGIIVAKWHNESRRYDSIREAAAFITR